MKTDTNPLIFRRYVVSMASVPNSMFSGPRENLFRATFLLSTQNYSEPKNCYKSTEVWILLELTSYSSVKLLARTSVPHAKENGVKLQQVLTLHSKWVPLRWITQDIINISARDSFHPCLISAVLEKTSPGSHFEDPTVQNSKSSSSTALLTSLVVLACTIVVTVLTVYIIKRRRLLSLSASCRRTR